MLHLHRPLVRRDSQISTETGLGHPDFGTFSTSRDPLLVPPGGSRHFEGSNKKLHPLAPNVLAGSENDSSPVLIQTEHGLGFIETCKLYPAAIGWFAFVR